MVSMNKEPISRGALMGTVENLTVAVAKLENENNALRALLAQGQGDCIYCNLPAVDIAKCSSGFPGCARMDDIMNAQETEKDRSLFTMGFALANTRYALTELLRGGEHDGPCDNEEEFSGIGPCWKHLEVSKQREDAARNVLDETAAIHVRASDTELKDAESLNQRLSNILDRTANALHGGPMDKGLWSFHDLPDLATALRSKLELAKTKVQAVLDNIPNAVHVLEGAGDEDVFASLAVSVAKLVHQKGVSV